MSATGGEFEFPGLAHQAVAEAVVPLAGPQPVAGAPVDAAGGEQQAVGPQPDAPVAGPARAAFALVDQRVAQAQAARRRFDEQHAQLRGARLGGLGGLVAGLHQEHAADAGAVALGDPAGLSHGVELLDEARRDLRHKGLETQVPAVFLRVQRAVARHHPAQVARVDVERVGQFGCGGVVAMGQFPRQARFGRREAAVRQALVQHADARA
jgi:hypothetical protein